MQLESLCLLVGSDPKHARSPNDPKMVCAETGITFKITWGPHLQFSLSLVLSWAVQN